MTAAWYLAIYLNNQGSWVQKNERAISETMCLQQARWKWQDYWASGKPDDNDMRLQCYSDDWKTRYWIRCTKSGSCSIK